MSWDPRSLPSLVGRTYAVTGGSRGIGYFVVEQLAAAGAAVLLLARSQPKADAAIAHVRAVAPDADVRFVPFDLDSLDAARAAAERLPEGVDGLALNAGLIWPPRTREQTADGLEKMVGSSHLAHFAFVHAALPKLGPTARIVSQGSMSTRTATADLGDLMQELSYDSNKSYPNSKHAVQAFGFELDRRLRASGSGIRSLVTHPGFALDVQAPRRGEVNSVSGWAVVAQNLLRPFTQGKDRGAWPTVRALVDPTAMGGEYYGPSGALKGRPVVVKPVALDRDPAFGAELWRLSEGWAGRRFTL